MVGCTPTPDHRDRREIFQPRSTEKSSMLVGLINLALDQPPLCHHFTRRSQENLGDIKNYNVADLGFEVFWGCELMKSFHHRYLVQIFSLCRSLVNLPGRYARMRRPWGRVSICTVDLPNNCGANRVHAKEV